MDRLRRTELKVPIDDRAIVEAVEKRPDFQRQSDAEGLSYLNAALTEIGLGLPYGEFPVAGYPEAI